MEDIPISHLMSNDMYHVSSKTCLKKILMTMRDNEMSCLMVCKDKQSVGIITNRFLVNILADGMQKSINKQL